VCLLRVVEQLHILYTHTSMRLLMTVCPPLCQAIRIVLHAIAQAAARYRRRIVPVRDCNSVFRPYYERRSRSRTLFNSDVAITQAVFSSSSSSSSFSSVSCDHVVAFMLN
jgi:ABC-type enterochelin transport system ATPase subunit